MFMKLDTHYNTTWIYNFMIRFHNPVHCICDGVIKNHLLTSERIAILSLCRKSTLFIIAWCFVTHFCGFLIHYLYFKVIHCSIMKRYRSGHISVWETTARQLAKGEWKFRVVSNIHFILAGLASNSCKASRNLKTLATITGLQL